MPINNSLQDVVTYQTKSALAMMEVRGCFAMLANREFDNWQSMVAQRGDTVTIYRPTLFRARNTLAFDPTNSGGFTEEKITLKVDKEASVNYAATDQQLATYPIKAGNSSGTPEGRAFSERKANEMGAELATVIDAEIAKTACFGGYRWAGDINASSSSIDSMQKLRQTVTKFRNYGGTELAHCVIPDISQVNIANTGFQEFILRRNEEMAKDWELPAVNGVPNTRFYSYAQAPVHTAGSAAVADAQYDITSVVDSTFVDPNTSEIREGSTIRLTGLPGSSTVLINDIGDIGTAGSGSAFNANDPIKFLRPRGHTTTAVNPQFRVVESTQADGVGTIDIKVEPRLIFDPTDEDPKANLSRAINPASDKLRLVLSHKAGVMWLDSAFFFACPKLPSVSPYISSTVQDEKRKMALRTYFGNVFGNNISQVVQDIIYGSTMAPGYAMRLIFPVNESIDV